MLAAIDKLSRYLLAGLAGLALLAPLSPADADHAKFLYGFQGGSDGMWPSNGLIFDKQGNLYGTTVAGGTGACNNGYGCGIIYALAPDGSKQTLYAFQGGTDGSAPWGLVRDDKGNLYSTTIDGGPDGDGTIFKLAPDGTKQMLYAFTGGDDGLGPWGPLLRDKAGNLYGTASQGGVNGKGAIFRLGRNGKLTVLYAFCAQPGCADGRGPTGTLIADAAGNLYGTTGVGGTADSGTVYKLSPGGQETVLYSFCVQTDCADGANPAFGVTMDAAGNLYGVTSEGGGIDNDQFGVVFKITPDGVESVLHNFTLEHDGTQPQGGLLLAHDGYLYGALHDGNGCANKRAPIYRLAMDGSEHLYCIRSGLTGNVMERNGYLYGVASASNGKNPYGSVFAMKK
jgi:uncharacterized repeat protein (TIGR03803 family)